MGYYTSFMSALGYTSPGKGPKAKCTSSRNPNGKRIKDPISGLINCAQDGLVLQPNDIWPGVLSDENPRGAYQFFGVWYITPSEAQRRRVEPVYLPGSAVYDAAGNVTVDPRGETDVFGAEAVKGQRNMAPRTPIGTDIVAVKGQRNIAPMAAPATLDGSTGAAPSLSDTVGATPWLGTDVGGNIRDAMLAGRLPDIGNLLAGRSAEAGIDRSGADLSDLPAQGGALAKPMNKSRFYLALLTIAVVLYFVYMLGQRGGR